jgi:hypothetical protein
MFMPSQRVKEVLRTIYKVGLVVVLVWSVVWIFQNIRTPRASKLVSASSPIALQYTNTNQGVSEALVVRSDGPSGILRTATRRIPGGSRSFSVSLAPALAADLTAIAARWCRGEHPVSSQPTPGSYEVVLFCGDGVPLLQLFLPSQDLPPAFQAVDQLVDH